MGNQIIPRIGFLGIIDLNNAGLVEHQGWGGAPATYA
jgi:hypothetical protein